MAKITKSDTRNCETAPNRSLFRSGLSDDGGRLARIRRKAHHEKGSDELAYERGAAIAKELPYDRAWAVAGMLHNLPSMQSAFVLIGGVDEQDRYRWASAVVDFEGYFGGSDD